MADPYSQAANIAAPFAQLGSQMFKGQALYDQGRAKSALQEAQRSAFESHAGLYGAQAKKANEEAAGLAQMRQYQTPEFATKMAANFSGLNEGQGAELSDFQQRGNWGVNPGKELPVDQAGPPMPDMPKSAPGWYTPQVEQRFNQARGIGLGNLATGGKQKIDDMTKAFVELLGRNDYDASKVSPEAALAYAQSQYAQKGGAPFHQGANGVMNVINGQEQLNDVGLSAALENRAQANNANASAGHQAASAALARSKIGQPTVNQDGSVTAPVASFGKAPAGYRFKQDGSLEPIPGGPVDVKINPPQRIQDANDVLSLLDMAVPIVDKATGSYFGTAADAAMRAVGKTTDGGEAAAQLKALEGALIAKMPKMSGPQSDKDVLLYKQMAGQIGDPTIPAEQKKAAMETIRAINSRNAKPQGSATAQNMSSQERQQSVLAARNAIANGRDKASVIKRLEENGITDHGIK